MKTITIKDVAKECNLSIRTVSRVINNDPNVKKETREKVLRVIEEMNYEVNIAAQTLRTKKTGLIVTFIDNRNGLYWGTYHNDFFNELYWVAKEKGYKMIISPSSHESYQDDSNDGFSLIKNKLCDGAVIFDANLKDERLNYLKENRIPFVVIGNSNNCQESNFIGLDNRRAGYLAAQHLGKKGYRKLALLIGNDSSIVNSLRIEGFKQYCYEEDIPYKISVGNIDLENIYNNSLKLIQEEKVDAFFVSGDERALGVYRAVQDNQLKVGDDIGVIGIDNLLFGEYLAPTLTSIASPKREIANNVIDTLIKNIDKEYKENLRTSFLPVVVERKSTRKKD